MLSIKSIVDPGYFLGGGSGCCAKTRDVRSAADYETDAIAGGEPPGRWVWRGENAFGATGKIRADGPSAAQFRRAMALHHPLTGEQLGVTPQTSKGVDERVKVWRRRNPDATPEQVAAYRMSTMTNEREAKYAWDLCFSPGKSWSVLWAAWEWAGRTDEAAILWECLEVGAQAAITHLFEQLAFIQGRPTGPEVGQRRTARYERALNLQMALFRHHMSRDGDPQTHIHAVLFNRVLNSKGQWRALYSPAFFRAKHEADAIFQRAAEAEAMRRLGLPFEWTPSGVSREIVGVSPEVREFFSSRDRALSEAAQQEVDHFTATKGRAPNGRERWRIRQQATLRSRKAKPAVPPTAEERLAQWESGFSAETRDSLADVNDAVDAARVDPDEPMVVPRYDPDTVIEQALADLEQRKSTWNTSLLVDAINRRLPGMLAVEPEGVARRLDELADRAIASGRVVSTEAKPAVPTPVSLQDAKSGRSVFDAPDGRRFTTRKTLEREGSLVARLDQLGAPQVSAERAAGLVAKTGIEGEQGAINVRVLSSGRWLEVIDSPAGTGKSTMTRGLSQAAEAQWGVGVTGMAIAENAAKVLRRSGLSRAHNIAAFLDFTEREKRGEVSDNERVQFAVAAGSYVVVDEASTVDTPRLTQLLDALENAGVGKVLLVGDRQQADPVDAGGGFAMLVDELEHRRREYERARQREPLALRPAQRAEQEAAMAAWTTPGVEREPTPVHRLRTVRRFANEWERDASTRLRDRDVTALRQYETRGRVHGDTNREKVRDAAVDAMVTDWLAGRDSIVIAGTTDEAAAAASRVRQRLVEAGHVEQDGAPLRADVGSVAGVGDIVQTRLNDKTVGALNRQRWQVVARADDGSLEVREELERDEHGELTWGPVHPLPAAYVQTQVELAYAATIHAVEGTTIGTRQRLGTSHTIVSRTMPASHVYVGLGRATGENHAWVELEGDETPVARLAAVVSRDDHQPAARSEMAVEEDRATNLGHLGPIWESVVRETRAATHRQMLRNALGVEADGVLQDRAVTRLFGLIRGAELSGHEPDELLVACAGKGSLSGSRSPASVLYARVADEMATGPKPRPVPVGFEARTPRPSRGDVEKERLAHARKLGKVMDRRAAHLAELAAVDQPAWAVRALGPVPADPDARARWIGDVALAAAYRERYGIDDDTTAVGRKPAHAEPERGWLWDMAAERIGMPEHERNLAGLSDGDLANRVQAWERQLAWAPRNVDEDLRGAHEALREARTQEVNARVQGREDADAVADVWAMTELVEKLEYVASVRARWHDHTTDAREAAEEARGEQRRRREVEQARGGLHPDDPGVEVEPEWDPEYDDAEYEDLVPGDVDGENVSIPLHNEREVDPREAAADAVMARVAATWTPDQPAAFGSREWSLLADDAPEKRAAVVAAAARLFNFGEPLDADRDEVDRRLNVRDVEEPAEWLDVETTARTQFWAEDHGLHVEAPRFGSPEWHELAVDDPRREASETYAATVWLNNGDDLDSRRARADKADEDAREAAAAREVVEGPHVEALDRRAAELERDAEPGGFQRPQVEPEPEPEVVEAEPADRARYAWVREAAERHEEQRRVVVEAEVPAPREPEVIEEPADVEPEPVPHPAAKRAAKDAQLREDLDRATAAVDRMERDEAAARERDADEQRQRDDDRAREAERDEHDRERVDY